MHQLPQMKMTRVLSMNAQNKKAITIKLLKDQQNCISELADIWCNELGKIWLPDVKKNRIIDNLNLHLNSESLPLTFVAFADDTPVGMCSLRENDGIRPDLMPWMGSLVVSSEYQNRGIGSLLIQTTIDKAQRMGFEKLYLFAFDKTIPNYYLKLGWNVIGTDNFKGHPVTVMDISL
jgi:predicted N-acetyltransferase YhbS